MNFNNKESNISKKDVNTNEFAQLYDKYVKSIYKFIYYKTHHKETAEDLTSDTFIKALDNFGTFDKKKGQFSTWLYQIARNTVIDFYRTKKSNINIDDVWDLAGDEDIGGDIDTAEKLKDVKKYLKTLKAGQREVVILRVWEGLSYKEIAQIIGKTENSCKMMFSRTIQTLRKEMPLGLFLYLIMLGW